MAYGYSADDFVGVYFGDSGGGRDLVDRSGMARCGGDDCMDEFCRRFVLCAGVVVRFARTWFVADKGVDMGVIVDDFRYRFDFKQAKGERVDE